MRGSGKSMKRCILVLWLSTLLMACSSGAQEVSSSSVTMKNETGLSIQVDQLSPSVVSVGSVSLQPEQTLQFEAALGGIRIWLYSPNGDVLSSLDYDWKNTVDLAVRYAGGSLYVLER